MLPGRFWTEPGCSMMNCQGHQQRGKLCIRVQPVERRGRPYDDEHRPRRVHSRPPAQSTKRADPGCGSAATAGCGACPKFAFGPVWGSRRWPALAFSTVRAAIPNRVVRGFEVGGIGRLVRSSPPGEASA